MGRFLKSANGHLEMSKRSMIATDSLAVAKGLLRFVSSLVERLLLVQGPLPLPVRSIGALAPSMKQSG